ncbi:CDP-alcohol phosphatidyltransferase family protein [Tsuneonella sp. HG249]
MHGQMPNDPVSAAVVGTPEPIQRVQQNVVARVERAVLTAICSRLPRWVRPDMLTAIGMVGAVMVMGGYAASHLDADWLWVAMAGYVVNWFGDSTDGSLARYRKIERPRYGYFLDHSCDALATALVVAGIGLSPYVHLDVALVALAGYLMMSIHAFLSVKVFGELRLSYMAAGPTELRIILIAFTASMLVFGRGPETIFWYDLFVGFAGAVLISLFIFQTIATARRLAVEEPPRN